MAEVDFCVYHNTASALFFPNHCTDCKPVTITHISSLSRYLLWSLHKLWTTLQHLQRPFHGLWNIVLPPSILHVIPKLFIPGRPSVHSTNAQPHFYRCNVLCDIIRKGYKYWICGGKDSLYSTSSSHTEQTWKRTVTDCWMYICTFIIHVSYFI